MRLGRVLLLILQFASYQVAKPRDNNRRHEPSKKLYHLNMDHNPVFHRDCPSLAKRYYRQVLVNRSGRHGLAVHSMPKVYF